MTTSRNSGHSRSDHSIGFLEGLPDLSRYDALLLAMPSLFLIALALHIAFTVPLQVAVTVGSLGGALLLADALYLNPPASDRPPQ